jgi:hypothetical protein
MSQRRGKNGRPGFEQRGGYASPPVPMPALPRVPAGPAPGAVARPAADAGRKPLELPEPARD